MGRARNRKKRTNEGRYTITKPARVRTDYGTLERQLRHARGVLCASDVARLNLLTTCPPQSLADDGLLDLKDGKRRILTPAEAVERERKALFTKARNAPHATERQDPIGRAWFAGLLDGHGADPIVMRDMGREYGWLYWQEYARLDAKASAYNEMVGRSQHRKFRIIGNTGAAGRRWERFEATIAPLGLKVRTAFQKLTCDDMWFLQGPEWLDRLINTARVSRGEPVVGELARRSDGETLRLAIMALSALVTGEEARKAKKKNDDVPLWRCGDQTDKAA